MASVIRRGDSGEELTPDELRQFQHRSIALFRYLENLHCQYRQGLFDEAEFSTEFRAEVDNELEKYTC